MRMFHLALSTCLIGAAACATPASRPANVAASAACERLGDTSKAVSDLFASGNIYGTRNATEDLVTGDGPPEVHQVGAELYVHALPGVTAEYLQRTLECYTAYSRAIHPNDPFHPTAGSVADVAVISAGDSFAIRVVGSNDQTAADISQRARALTSTVSAQQVSESSGQVAPF